MPDVDWYIDTARQRLSLKSDMELTRHLGFKGNNLTHWRTRRSLPSDENMVALADAAGVDDGAALLDLSEWRARARHETRAADAYARLRSLLKVGTAAMLALAIASVGGAATAAATDGEQVRTSGADIYIMRWQVSSIAVAH